LYFLTHNPECAKYINSTNFKKDFEELYANDQEMFTEPENWEGKTMEQSPLVNDFSTMWEKLKETYRNELSQLAFTQIPDEKDVAKAYIEIIQQVIKK
jgi:hypothetical protein